MRNLIYLREQLEIKNISKRLQHLVLEKEKPFFEVWMADLNDEIQDLAQSFGERFMLQAAFYAYDTCFHAGAKELLYKNLRMHMVAHLRDNMSFYLVNDLISKEAAKGLVNSFD